MVGTPGKSGFHLRKNCRKLLFRNVLAKINHTSNFILIYVNFKRNLLLWILLYNNCVVTFDIYEYQKKYYDNPEFIHTAACNGGSGASKLGLITFSG